MTERQMTDADRMRVHSEAERARQARAEALAQEGITVDESAPEGGYRVPPEIAASVLARKLEAEPTLSHPERAELLERELGRLYRHMEAAHAASEALLVELREHRASARVPAIVLLSASRALADNVGGEVERLARFVVAQAEIYGVSE